MFWQYAATVAVLSFVGAFITGDADYRWEPVRAAICGICAIVFFLAVVAFVISAIWRV